MIVVAVDMWQSWKAWPTEKSWPHDVNGEWDVEAVCTHNEHADDLYREACRTHGLRDELECGTQGDGRLYLFDGGAGDAVATFVHELLSTFPKPGKRPERIDTSVGVAVGPVTITSVPRGVPEYRGWPVDVAARLSIAAGEHQVLADKSAREVFGNHPEFDLEDDYTPIRLPGAGSSVEWPTAAVFAVRVAGSEPTAICNFQARLEQFAHIQHQAVERLKKFDVWKDAQVTETFGNVHPAESGALVAILGRLDELVGPVSELESFVAQFRSGGHAGRRTRVQPAHFEEMNRDPTMAAHIARLVAHIDDLRSTMTSHWDRQGPGYPNIESPLLIGSRPRRKAAATELNRGVSRVIGALNGMIRRATKALVEPGPARPDVEPAMPDQYVV